jgi:NADPH:quinone reductase-like Zn-dependent oxidoreductase
MKLRYKLLNGIAVLLVITIAALAITLGHNSECTPARNIATGTESMQAIVYTCYGPPEVLNLEKFAKPVPADDQVLVAVHAASVNPLDWHYMRGAPYFMRLMTGIGAPHDQRFGTDFSGTVESIGANVTKFKPGDAVFGGASGAFGEYVVVGETRALAIKASKVTFEQAASLPIAAISALQALRDVGKIQPGMKVLVNGASGGVGTFAVQIAKHFGAEVTGVCSTRNIELVLSLGADHVVNYKQENYTEGGTQYDLIIDNVGNHSPLANRRAMTPDGMLVMVGGPGGNWVGPLIRPLQAALLSPFVDQKFELFLAELNQPDLEILAELSASGEISAVIDRRYTLEDVPEAIRYSESGRARGKIVIGME